jgi:hypothetical protein
MLSFGYVIEIDHNPVARRLILGHLQGLLDEK